MRRALFLLLVGGLFVGCADSAAPDRSKDPGHNTLGTWPNVVIVHSDPTKDPKIDAQKTAADILAEILKEAMVDADDPTKLGPAKFKQLVDLVQKCGRHTAGAPATISAHAAKIIAAWEAAKKHTQEDWNTCIAELSHGHE